MKENFIKDMENYIISAYYFAGQNCVEQSIIKSEKNIKDILKYVFHYRDLDLAKRMSLVIYGNLSQSRIFNGDIYRNFCKNETAEQAINDYKQKYGSVAEAIIENKKKKIKR